MTDTTNLVTPKAGGHAPATFKDDAAAVPPSPDKKEEEVEWPEDGLLKKVPKDPTDAQTTFKEAVAGAASAVADNNLDTAKAKKKDLDEVVDANLGKQEDRSAKRKWSLVWLFLKLALAIVIETTLCFIFYYLFITNRPKRRNRRLHGWSDREKEGKVLPFQIVKDDPYGGKVVGWPSLPGVSTVLSIIGGALTFLLVFSLNWTFQRWRSARALMGGTVTTLKHFYVHVSTACTDADLDDPEMENIWLALQWFGATVIICINNLKPEESILAKLGIESILAKLGIVKDDMGLEDSDNELAINRSDLRLEVYRAHTQIGRDLQKLHKKHKLEGPERAISYNMHSKLLDSFEGLCKYKTTSLPLLLKGLLYILTYAYTFLIFPVLLPYTFVMSLDEPAVRNEILWDGAYAPCFIAIFVVSSSLILFYFNMLLSISQEFEDPFGADYSDIRLRRDFMEPLLDHFQQLKQLQAQKDKPNDDGEADKTADRESEATVKN